MIERDVREAARFHVAIAAKCVVPLFGVNDGKVELFASATLVQIGDGSTFLFTAGHALDLFGSQSPMIAWPTPGHPPVEILGSGFTTEPRRPYRELDKLDLAFIELPREKARELRNAGALVMDATALTADVPGDTIYAVIGHPIRAATSTSAFEDDGRRVNILEAPPKVIFGSPVEQSVYERLSRDTRLNILLHREPVGTHGGHQMKNPQGMSGGGIFSLGTRTQLLAGAHDLRLSGIATEYRKKLRIVIGASAIPMSDIFRRATEPSTIDGTIVSRVTRID